MDVRDWIELIFVVPAGMVGLFLFFRTAGNKAKIQTLEKEIKEARADSTQSSNRFQEIVTTNEEYRAQLVFERAAHEQSRHEGEIKLLECTKKYELEITKLQTQLDFFTSEFFSTVEQMVAKATAEAHATLVRTLTQTIRDTLHLIANERLPLREPDANS